MSVSELATVSVFIVVLLGVAGTFGWLQVRNLRRLRQSALQQRDDYYFERAKSYRRIVGCLLMLVLAFLLGGAYFMGLEKQVLEIIRLKQEGEELTADQARFVQLYSGYWSLVLLVLMCMLFLAAADLLSIRRFGLKQYRKLQEDRRAMVERQAALLRSERNGHEGND